MDVMMGKRTVVCYDKVWRYCDTREEAVETVVPDTMPDIERILGAEGAVIIRSKEVGVGSVSLSAGVAASVMYVPEDGQGARCISVAIPFSVELNAPGVSQDSVPVARLTIVSLEARMLNPRKLVVRACVAICLECYDRGVMEFCERLAGEDCCDIKTLALSEDVCPVVCVKEKTFVVSDEYRVPAGRPPLNEILRSTAELMLDDVKYVGSKLVIKGRAVVCVVYCAADSGALTSLSFETAFSQLVETDCELTAPDCDVSMLLTAVYIEPATLSGGDKGLSCELHCVAQTVCTDSVNVSYISDCYSNRHVLEPTRQSGKVKCAVRRVPMNCALHERAETEQTVAEVCGAYCRASEATWEKGMLRCRVTAEIVYTDDTGALQSVSRRINAECGMEPEEGFTVTSVSAVCCSVYATPAQKSVELRLSVDFCVTLSCEKELSQVTDIVKREEAPATGGASVTLVRAGEGMSLWKLAKKYCSTCEAIKAINGIAEDESICGRVLLIPASK
ncbi:MAG: DUF3794 domain-containing protein [Oscillospiraceae bacterium]